MALMAERDQLIIEIRRYPHASWGTTPRRDGSWECFFEVSGPKGLQRLHAYGKTEIEALGSMLEILQRENFLKAPESAP
jgi:hypothetical protein